MVSINMRPPEIEDRVMPGQWEDDLIKGARNASAVGTLKDRVWVKKASKRAGWSGRLIKSMPDCTEASSQRCPLLKFSLA